MRQYLVEGATGAVPFFVDRTKPIVFEARADGRSSRIPGRFSICDCVNGNNRRYSKRVWEKNLQTGSALREAMKRNAAFGFLEHPKDGIVDFLSPISHHVTEADLKEEKGTTGKMVCEVHGTIEILETPEGGKLKALIEGGYNPMVSSRGYGSLEKGTDGVDNVCDDYVCEGWDVVIKPSFDTAELDSGARTASTCHQIQTLVVKYGQQTNAVLAENTPKKQFEGISFNWCRNHHCRQRTNKEKNYGNQRSKKPCNGVADGCGSVPV